MKSKVQWLPWQESVKLHTQWLTDIPGGTHKLDDLPIGVSEKLLRRDTYGKTLFRGWQWLPGHPNSYDLRYMTQHNIHLPKRAHA